MGVSLVIFGHFYFLLFSCLFSLFPPPHQLWIPSRARTLRSQKPTPVLFSPHYIWAIALIAVIIACSEAYMGPFHRVASAVLLFPTDWTRGGKDERWMASRWHTAASPNARRSSSGFPLLTAAGSGLSFSTRANWPRGPQKPINGGRLPFPIAFSPLAPVHRPAS